MYVSLKTYQKVTLIFSEYDWYKHHREFHVEFKKAHPKKTKNFENNTNSF